MIDLQFRILNATNGPGMPQIQIKVDGGEWQTLADVYFSLAGTNAGVGIKMELLHMLMNIQYQHS